MNPQQFFAFCPHLKPFSFKPSEDHPTEYLLILEEDGAALGISHAEKRLIERMDGRRSVADLVKQLVNENLAPAVELRRLLWDLDRYGFLQKSPWPNAPGDAWGYWGFPLNACAFFTCRRLLGPVDGLLGRWLPSLQFCITSVILFLILVGINWNLFYEQAFLLIGDSAALAILVVIVSLAMGFMVATGFTSMVLREIHKGPVRCLTDYRFSLPLFRLDGRRFRALPFRQALLSIVSPILALFLLAGMILTLASISDGVRREWLFHVAISFWLAGFLLLLPWNSTVLSREIVLRLRGDSIFWTMARAVRKAFGSLFQQQKENVPHERLFLFWGVWAIVGTLLLIRLLTTVFRWDFPILINHFLQEDNIVILTILLIISAVTCAALIAATLTFFLWLIREITGEIRRRYWPRHDHFLVSLAVIALLFLFSQWLWSTGSLENTALSIMVSIVAGFLLALFSFLAWKHEKGGYEPFAGLILLFAGLVLMAYGFETYLSQPKTNDPGRLSQWLIVIAALVFLNYISSLYLLKFRSSTNSSLKNPATIPVAVGCLVILLSLSLCTLYEDTWIGNGGQIIAIIYVCIIGCFTILRGSLRNNSLLFLSLSILLLMSGMVWNPELGPNRIAELLIIAGVVIGLGGLCIRSSVTTKTALGEQRAVPTQLNRIHSNASEIAHVFLDAAEDLYNAAPLLDLPSDAQEEQIKPFFQQFHSFTGSNAFRAIFRRASYSLSWQDIQRICKNVPASVAIPSLADWDKERIEHSLQKVPTFAHIGNEINRITPRMRFVLFDPGDTFIRQGEKGGFLYCIVEGKVSVELHHPFGHTVQAIFTDGNFVGEIGFLTGGLRTAAVRAWEPTLTLAIHRDDIDNTMPHLQSAIREAEAGQSWLQALHTAKIIREFPPALRHRVGLESQHIYLDRMETLSFETKPESYEIGVLLSGECTFIKDGESYPIQPGSLIGLTDILDRNPVRGLLRAESRSHLLLIEHSLFLEALTEILTPIQILQAEEEQLSES